MERKMQNKLRMFETARLTVQEHSVAWQDMPAFNNAFGVFEQLLDGL
jgi:hypothetical protein